MKKSCDVFWSGGLDSTYMIYKLLVDGWKINAYYIKLLNNPNKTNRELKSIEKLRPYFEKYDFKFDGVLSSFELIKPFEALSFSFCPQSMIWIIMSSFLAGPVCFGYVMGDDSISYLNDYKKLANDIGILREKKLEFMFPLSKTSKQEIVNFMPKELLKYVTTCESETTKNSCGKCKNCLKLKELLKSKNVGKLG